MQNAYPGLASTLDLFENTGGFRVQMNALGEAR